MITRKGFGIIAVAIAVFFLASTTRVGWVHLADAVLWGVVLVSLVIPWISLPGVRVERQLQPSNGGSPGPVEGDSFPVTLSLSNRWWVPRFLVVVSYPVSAADLTSTQRSIFFWVWPRHTVTVDTPIQLKRRGPHSLGEAVVEISGPFGLFRRRSKTSMVHSFLVYPRWQPMRNIGLAEAAAGETEGRRRSRTGFDASGTRAYVPGDPYRSIHWRNSARSGRLAVREFDSRNDHSYVFAIDTANVTGSSPESSLDYAARVAASCTKVILAGGGTVSVLTGSGESPEFLDWPAVMEHLARLTPEPDATRSIAPAVSALSPGRTLIALLTPSSTHEISAVCAASHRGVASFAAMCSESGNFADSGVESNGISELRQAGVPVVRVAPGMLDQALADIEDGEGFAAGLRRRPASYRQGGEEQVAA